MRVHASHLTALIALGAGGCLLEPLVDDVPSVSVHVQPPGTPVPAVADDLELTHQITVNDGLDDRTLADAGGVVTRLTGWAGGVQVRYWSFGKTVRTAASAYVLVDSAGVRIDHPYLFDGIPGDPGYSPLRRLQQVVVTAAYRGERITTVEALSDAIELGLLLPPEPLGTYVNAPVVPPGTTLEVGGDREPAAPQEVYARGFRVPAFVLGGGKGIQPLRSGFAVLGQAALMREGNNVTPLATPCFQYTPPPAPAAMTPNYTPLANVINVKLAPGVVAADTIHADSDLFLRTMTGAIRATTPNVADFEITTEVWNWPLQFEEGLP